VREHVQQRLLDGAFVDDDAARGGDGDSGDTEEDVGDVHPDAGAKDDYAQAAEKAGAVDGIALVEFGLLGAGGGEGRGFATEELGEEEGSDDGDGVIC
jgi:hypothetical protein